MATGRTHAKHWRVYASGYDLSSHTLTFGPLTETYSDEGVATLTDAVKGTLPGRATIGIGTLNGVFDNTATTGLHIVAGTTAKRVVMAAGGIRTAPAAGDPVFAGEFEQLGYHAITNDDGIVTVSIPFGASSAAASSLAYGRPWGRLLHALSAATAANSATGAGVDNAAASTAGGFFVYQVTAGDGTATLSVDDSADDSSYSALSGATSGELDMTSRQSGIVALGTTATVKRYLRWQVSLNTATTVTFASAFVRG